MITGHFIDADLPTVDGVVRVARSYRALMERELGPSWLIAPSHPGHRDEAGFRKISFPSIAFREPYRIGVPSLAPALPRKIDRIALDIAHSHTPFAAGRIAAESARRAMAPLVFSLHSRYPQWARTQYSRNPKWLSVLGLDLARRPPRLHRFGLRDLLEVTDTGLRIAELATQRMIWDHCLRADCVLVSSEAFHRELLTYADAFPRKVKAGPGPSIRVVLQGIDFPEKPARAVRLRERHRIPRDTPILLYVGQLAVEKELPFLLDAMGALRARGQDFRLLLVGEGPDRRALEAQAAALGIGDRCHFCGSVLDQGVLADYYSQAELFLFPSLYETQGLAAMEAASFGLPLVSQVGAPGLSEVFAHGETAIFAERDPGAYAATVQTLLQSTERARQVGDQARRVVRRVGQAVRQVSGIYGELLRDRPKPPGT